MITVLREKRLLQIGGERPSIGEAVGVGLVARIGLEIRALEGLAELQP